MNRQIRFRGKRVDNGEWIVGDLLHIAGGCLIYFGDHTQTEHPDIERNSPIAIEFFKDEIAVVDSDTVCQFTGLLDKNGKEIYEGDIVRYYDDIEDELVSSHVIYHKESCSFCIAPTKLCGDYIGLNVYWQFEVIGNIHDTPSLLNEKER